MLPTKYGAQRRSWWRLGLSLGNSCLFVGDANRQGHDHFVYIVVEKRDVAIEVGHVNAARMHTAWRSRHIPIYPQHERLWIAGHCGCERLVAELRTIEHRV